jgi:hypothetical protein
MTWQWISSIALIAATVAYMPAADVAPLLSRIKAVGKEGKGNADASAAWRELVKEGPDALPNILAALDDASPTSANWLRSAVDAIADRALRVGKLSPAPLEKFVKETRHTGAARRLAFEWLVKADPDARDRLLTSMLNDPGSELRREAVEVELKKAQALFEKDDRPAALSAFRKLLDAARDRDQVKLIAERLEKLGAPVDLTTHFGFITRWALVGPFDNANGVGFGTALPPEKGVDLKSDYPGLGGKRVRWIEHTAEPPTKPHELDQLGVIDLNKRYQRANGDTSERMREAVVFGFAAIESKQDRPVEVRAASNNAIRIWLNGKEVFFREEYHHGMEMDQHVGKGTLKAGRNEILIKVCQNEQDEVWARLWSFQLRVCDALGTAVPLAVVTEKLTSKNGGGE